MCNVACLRQLGQDWKTVQEVIFFHLWRRLPHSPAHSAAVSCLLLLSQQGPITILVYLSPLLWSFPLNGVFQTTAHFRRWVEGLCSSWYRQLLSLEPQGLLNSSQGLGVILRCSGLHHSRTISLHFLPEASCPFKVNAPFEVD